jgi:arginyl-tRNA synthetase
MNLSVWPEIVALILQYAYARASAILRKAGEIQNLELGEVQFDENERLLALKLSAWQDAFARAAREYMPHNICNYLYELAQEFNRFYEKSKVVGDEREKIRLSLVSRYATSFKIRPRLTRY